MDLSQEVRGKSRVGNRLSALIAELRSIFRLPIRQMQTWLDIHYGLKVSIGEISEITARVAQAGKPAYEALPSHVPTTPVCRLTRTGWPVFSFVASTLPQDLADFLEINLHANAAQ